MRRTGLGITLGLAAALVAALAVAEQQGWPFLASPAQRWLSQRLARPVSLADDSGTPALRLHLLGGITLSAPQLRIANAPGMGDEPMLLAQGLHLGMAWSDAWRWRPGLPLRLQALSADSLALQLQRLADGRANWTLGTADPQAPTPAPGTLVQVADARIAQARARLQDAVLQLDLSAHGTMDPQQVLDARAEGRYRDLPLTATLRAGPLSTAQPIPPGTPARTAPASAPGAQTAPQPATRSLPITLAVRVGRAELDFKGQLTEPLGQRRLLGDYRVAGPSLAAVGRPLGLTLPESPAFAMRGRLAHAGTRWSTVVAQATIGRSRLAGAFQFDNPPGAVPMLAGRLHGPALLMQDLGPALGTSADGRATPPSTPGKVLPDRRFNLPALRAMNANVLVALDRFDFGSTQLQAAAPLAGHLVLHDGVLALNDLDATLAQGRLRGHVRLDGRTDAARWDVDLQARGLRLAQWLHALQRPNAPPWASGRLAAHLVVTGTGRSTADLLASADGRLQLGWTQGTLSHLAVEAAGLDVAQALGVLLRGDDALPVACAAGDLAIRRGVVTPRVLLADTRDSTLWLDGQVSLASEQLALVAHVQPKDWSPLSLRTPLRIGGTLGKPALSLQKGPLLQRVLPAALLALVSPLAGLLPLMDLGGAEPGAPKDVGGCAALVRRWGTPAGGG